MRLVVLALALLFTATSARADVDWSDYIDNSPRPAPRASTPAPTTAKPAKRAKTKRVAKAKRGKAKVKARAKRPRR